MLENSTWWLEGVVKIYTSSFFQIRPIKENMLRLPPTYPTYGLTLNLDDYGKKGVIAVACERHFRFASVSV